MVVVVVVVVALALAPAVPEHLESLLWRSSTNES